MKLIILALINFVSNVYADTCTTSSLVELPDFPQYLRMINKLDEILVPGDKIGLECVEANHYMSFAANVSCIGGNEFSLPPEWPKCTVKCVALISSPDPAYELEAVANASELMDVGEFQQFRCKENKFVADSNSRSIQSVCQISGHFKPKIFPKCETRCDPEHLRPLLNPEFHDLVAEIEPLRKGESAEVVQCRQKGLFIDPSDTLDNRIASNLTLICTNLGQFRPDISDLRPCVVRCSIPADMPDSLEIRRPSTPNFAVGTEVVFGCREEKFTLEDGVSTELGLECRSDGHFGLDLPVCTRKCDLDQIDTDEFVVSNAPSHLEIGTQVRLWCKEDNAYVDNNNYFDATCLDNGDLDVNVSCVTKCRVPEAPRSTGLVPPQNKKTNDLVVVETVVEYECLRENSTVGMSTSRIFSLKCGSQGTFDLQDWPECSIKCLPLTQVPQGYSLPSAQEILNVGEWAEFECSDPNAYVGTSPSRIHWARCLNNGQFESPWPECAVRCAPAIAPFGYDSLPAGTKSVEPGQSLVYKCSEKNSFVTNTSSNEYRALCNEDGKFNMNFPDCETKCPLPVPPNDFEMFPINYGDYSEESLFYEVGQRLRFRCMETSAVVINGHTNEFEVTCGNHGYFEPSIWPKCVISTQCNIQSLLDTIDEFGLKVLNNSNEGYKTGDELSLGCSNEDFITDAGPKIQLRCDERGEFRGIQDLSHCREPQICPNAIPIPPIKSGLIITNDDNNGNNTNTTIKEGQIVRFGCSNSTHNMVTIDSGGRIELRNDFEIECRPKQGFPEEPEWPECRLFDENDYNEDESQEEICHCRGDNLEPRVSREIRENCGKRVENREISRVRCGSTNRLFANQQTSCFCDHPRHAPESVFGIGLVLRASNYYAYNELIEDSRATSPNEEYEEDSVYYEWLALLGTIMDDALLFSNGAASLGFVEAKIRHLKPMDDFVVIINDSDEMQNNNNNSSTNSSTEEGNIENEDNVCVLPDLAQLGYRMSSNNDTSKTKLDVNTTLNIECTNDSNQKVNIICSSLNNNNTNNMPKVSLEPLVSEWPECNVTNSKRRKRNADNLARIKVDLVILLMNEKEKEEVDNFVRNNLFNEGTKRELENHGFSIDYNDCDETDESDEENENIEENDEDEEEEDHPLCLSKPLISGCSNAYLEQLVSEYTIMTPFGYFHTALSPESVDAANVVQIGQFVAMRCRDEHLVPLRDDRDHFGHDQVIVATCQDKLHKKDAFGRFNVWPVPPCVSVCPANLPRPPLDSGLRLAAVLHLGQEYTSLSGINNGSETSQVMKEGDRLVYECEEQFEGVYGGRDVRHDLFGCNEAGDFDIPTENWPECSSQEQMIRLGVSQMLSRFDQRLSERHKLMAFRAAEVELAQERLREYFVNITIPLILALVCAVTLLCCCCRMGSPVFDMCDTKLVD